MKIKTNTLYRTKYWRYMAKHSDGVHDISLVRNLEFSTRVEENTILYILSLVESKEALVVYIKTLSVYGICWFGASKTKYDLNPYTKKEYYNAVGLEEITQFKLTELQPIEV